MPGPLPNASVRRRNQPTIATTVLPRAGRRGRVPECPYALGDAGSAWWRWAWKSPQAARWDDGALYFVARRAVLEDERAKLEYTDDFDMADLLAGADDEAVERVEFALSTLKRVASGGMSIAKEMRELDNRLGLNPKAMADLRWSVGDAEDEAVASAPLAEVKEFKPPKEAVA